MTIDQTMSRRAVIRRGVTTAAIAAGATISNEPAAPSKAQDVLSTMTLPERAALLFMYPVTGTVLSTDDAAWLRRDKPGGVILLGGNMGTHAEIAALIAAIHATNPGLPPLVGVDQEGGLVSRIPDDPAPSAPEMGLLSEATISTLSAERARVLHDYGFDVNFAPVADIAWSPDSFMAGRAFGSDPTLVSRDVAAVFDGVRGAGVAHVAKHFPGHGRGAVDSHEALPVVDIELDAWHEADALPFAAAIEAGAPGIMLGHLQYPRWDTLPASLSPEAVRVLREELNFGGAIVTDDLGMGALSAYSAFETVDLALAAGVDLLLYAIPPLPLADLIAHLVEQVGQGLISEDQINERAARVLALRD